MERLEVSGALRLIYRSLGVKGLKESSKGPDGVYYCIILKWFVNAEQLETQFCTNSLLLRMISGFRREVAKNCSLLAYCLLFFDSRTLRMGPIVCPETSEKKLPLI